MVSLVQETEAESIQAQAQLWKFVYGFAESLVLRAAVELGLPDIIHNNGGPITLSQVASKLPFPPVDSDHLRRIMRFLVHMNIFSQDVSGSEEQYGLEPAARLLLKGTEKSMIQSILGMTQKDFMLPWHYLKDGLGDDGTAFEKAMGMTIWDYLDAHPENSQLFNEGMAAETRLLTESLVNGCDDIFRGVDSLVDVGGGNGTALKAISKAFPHIKCTVFDLSRVIDESPDIPGLDRVAGDMFTSVPSAQAILLKQILHDWSDEDCLKILKKCKEAVPINGGKVIILDVVLDETSDHELTKPRMVLDIDMLVNTGGKERTIEDWNKLIKKAGYKGCNIRHIGSIQSVIEAFPH
ncbi:3'-hydroxy-N-methyl-(S)-coclaurine 4'-O-methyltransferase-like [Magnolia sinica]|uniref:3'-hydroxy-N-methyl-(S)-coclaurine 4'-O-methyltransferase-like n=1 Tax=Magnolia sinica TaxID=86752 RepID=UPI0026598639|nr:3'-hydroxy-N-methyl-(S)-coclaurine 4'-O-methyltransferase-like [Magnolia sinica]